MRSTRTSRRDPYDVSMFAGEDNAMPSAKKPQREGPKKAQPQVRARIVFKVRDEVNLPYHKGASVC